MPALTSIQLGSSALSFCGIMNDGRYGMPLPDESSDADSDSDGNSDGDEKVVKCFFHA